MSATRINQRGFTLVELLVVMAILGLIVGLVGPQVMKQLAGAKVDTARLQLSELSAALDLFYLDVGRYPTTSEGLDALVAAPVAVAAWDGPYLRKRNVPDDPWGNAYRYKAPGDHGSYDLYSSGVGGSSGSDGRDTAIGSWE